MSPIPPETARLAAALRVILGRTRRRLREVTDSNDLTTSQISVLSRLEKDGPTSASLLAQAERVRPQSMATLLASLEQRELVRRDPDPDDGRRQVVSLTPAARDFVLGTRQARDEWLATALQGRFTVAERATIAAALTLLERIVDE